MNKAKYAWVTLAPLAWVATVTLTAGWMKVFADDPRLGFLAHARMLGGHLAAGTLPAGAGSAEAVRQMIFNDRLDAAVAGFFMVCVVLVILASAREWWLVLSGRKVAVTTEVPFSRAA